MSVLTNKCGIVLGAANERSIAYGIARELANNGATVALTYQNETFGSRVRPLTERLGTQHKAYCLDVTDEASIDNCVSAVKATWGKIDFLVHSLATSSKDELNGRFRHISRENFYNSLDISCYSFISLANKFANSMPDGGAMLTMTFQGARNIFPYYNVMGVAKAALEASVRYLANDLGGEKIRVNAISAGPMRTLAGSAIGGARNTFRTTQKNAPMRDNAKLEHIGGTAVYLISDYGRSTSGEIIHVDGGYHIMGMPRLENL